MLFLRERQRNNEERQRNDEERRRHDQMMELVKTALEQAAEDRRRAEERAAAQQQAFLEDLDRLTDVIGRNGRDHQ